jgi:hypothetical protein
MASKGPFDRRCVLWNISDQIAIYVGKADADIFPIGLTDSGFVLGQIDDQRGQKIAVICPPDGEWHFLGTNSGWVPTDINATGDVVGNVKIDGIDRPWLRLHHGELIMLPYVISHHTYPRSINNAGQIVGSAMSDHGKHAVVWETL